MEVEYVDHCEDPAAGRKHLADISDAILNVAVLGCDEGVVGDVYGVEFNVVRARVERVLGLGRPGLRGLE